MSATIAVLTVAGRPLLALPHADAGPIRRRVRYPVRAIPRRNGSAQRVVLGTAPLHEVTYAHVCTTVEESGALLAFLHAAGGDTGDLRVAVPRWEDAVEVAVPGVALDGTAVPVAAGALAGRSFAPGAPVLFWRPNPKLFDGIDVVDVATLSDAAIADGDAALALADGAAAAWAPGTQVVPVSFARLVPPRDVGRLQPPFARATLSYTLDDRDLAGDGADAGVTAVPAAVSVISRGGGSAAGAGGVPGGHRLFEAVVTDAAGLRLTGQPVVWTASAVDHGLGFPITPLVAPLVDPQQVLVSVADTGPYSVAEVVVTATLSRPGLGDLVTDSGLIVFNRL